MRTRVPRAFVALSPIAGVLLLAFPTKAETIRVPFDFPTIYQALDAAVSGDEVLVAPGTYSATTTHTFTFKDPPEIITLQAAGFLKPGVTLRSEAGAATTRIRVLDAGIVHGLVMAQPPEDSPTVVQGFTFQAPFAQCAAVFTRELLDDGTLLVQDCAFEELDGGYDEAGGIYAFGGGTVRVISSTFRDVGSQGDFGAIGTAPSSLANGLSVHLLDVQGATFQDCPGPAVHSRATRTRVLNSQFTASGVRASVALHALVEDCSFINCGVSVGVESVERAGSAVAEVRRCTVIGAGGMNFTTPHTIVEDCSFTGSTQVSLAGPNDVSFRRNVFREVAVQWFFGIVFGYDVIGEISNNTFVGCSFDPPFGPGAMLWVTALSGELAIHHNIFAGTLSGIAVEAHAAELGTLTESCNCYWNNLDGDTSGFDMSPTSFVADPLFCDPSLFEVTIRSDSPCAPPGPTGCGLVGAGAVACGMTQVESSSWAKVKALYR